MPKRKRTTVDQKRIEQALEIIEQFSLIDGSHHKNWVIVEVTKALCGTDAKYEEFIERFDHEEDGEVTNGWNCMLEEDCIPP